MSITDYTQLGAYNQEPGHLPPLSHGKSRTVLTTSVDLERRYKPLGRSVLHAENQDHFPSFTFTFSRKVPPQASVFRPWPSFPFRTATQRPLSLYIASHGTHVPITV